jgi:hypothetical protein
MRKVAKELWIVFWEACKETPKGMISPLIFLWQRVMGNSKK